MGELVAWVLGLGLGILRNMLTTRWRILLFVIAILLLGALITLLSGDEMESKPWLVIVDIGQVAVAALIGAYALPFALRRLRNAITQHSTPHDACGIQ